MNGFSGALVMSPSVYAVDELLPLPKLFALGLQHLLVMYANAVAAPLIVAAPFICRKTRLRC
jgi:xanthine/uracil permease